MQSREGPDFLSEAGKARNRAGSLKRPNTSAGNIVSRVSLLSLALTSTGFRSSRHYVEKEPVCLLPREERFMGDFLSPLSSSSVFLSSSIPPSFFSVIIFLLSFFFLLCFHLCCVLHSSLSPALLAHFHLHSIALGRAWSLHSPSLPTPSCTLSACSSSCSCWRFSEAPTPSSYLHSLPVLCYRKRSYMKVCSTHRTSCTSVRKRFSFQEDVPFRETEVLWCTLYLGFASWC